MMHHSVSSICLIRLWHQLLSCVHLRSRKGFGYPFTANAMLCPPLDQLSGECCEQELVWQSKLHDACRLGAGYAEQLRVLFVRSMKTRRFQALGIQRFCNFGLTGAIAGLLWWQRGSETTVSAGQDIAALLFFETVRILLPHATD